MRLGWRYLPSASGLWDENIELGTLRYCVGDSRRVDGPREAAVEGVPI